MKNKSLKILKANFKISTFKIFFISTLVAVLFLFKTDIYSYNWLYLALLVIPFLYITKNSIISGLFFLLTLIPLQHKEIFSLFSWDVLPFRVILIIFALMVFFKIKNYKKFTVSLFKDTFFILLFISLIFSFHIYKLIYNTQIVAFSCIFVIFLYKYKYIYTFSIILNYGS